jgi:hypothetical protein
LGGLLEIGVAVFGNWLAEIGVFRFIIGNIINNNLLLLKKKKKKKKIREKKEKKKKEKKKKLSLNI